MLGRCQVSELRDEMTKSKPLPPAPCIQEERRQLLDGVPGKPAPRQHGGPKLCTLSF